MKSMGGLNKIIENGVNSKDGKSIKIENTKIKQSNGPGLFKSLKESGGLEKLTIKSCRLKVLPNEISQLINLKKLYIEDNKIQEVPNLESLENLEELVLTNNEISRFQVSISKLLSLRVLDLSSNILGTIPVRLFGMNSLRELYLDDNQFSHFPTHLCELQSLLTLSFSDNQLKAIPDQIGQMKSLTKLIFSGNQLESIPIGIANIKSLVHLDLSSNSISQIPSEYGQLKNLQFLYLQHNKIRSLPDEIGSIVSISVIRLNNNNITCLPPTINNLEYLTELYISENRLATLPNEIGHCKSLKRLQMEYNKIQLLPDTLKSLHSLNVLTLHDNSLEELPSFLTLDFLQHLIRFTIHGNPFLRDYQSEVIDSLTFLTNYLTQHTNQSNNLSSSSSLSSSCMLSGSNSGLGQLIETIKEDEYFERGGQSHTSNGSGLLHGATGQISSSPSGNNGFNGLPKSPSSMHMFAKKSPLPKLNLHKSLLTTKDFSSEDSDSDSDTNSNSGSLYSKRSSISPRTSLTLSNSIDSINSINNNNNNNNINNNNYHQHHPHHLVSSLSSNNIHAINSSSNNFYSSSPSSPIHQRPRRGSSNESGTSSPGGKDAPILTRSSSSFLNMLNRRKSTSGPSGGSGLTSSVSSTQLSTPPASPTYKSFQSLFESLLEDLDYSKRRKEELINLSNEDKWNFLQKIKPDCTSSLINHGIYQLQSQASSSDIKALISSPPKLNGSQTIPLPKQLPTLHQSTTIIPKSPRSYSKVLSLHSLHNFEDISKLKSQLVSKPVPWVINYAESTGIIAILSMISTFSSKEVKSEDDILILNECLQSIKLLIELEMQSLLLNDTTEIIFPLILIKTISIKRMALEVIDLMCKKFSLGSFIVLDSIKSYAKKNNLSLCKVFSYITGPLDGEYAADLKLNCMSLINHIIRGCKNFDHRIEIRSEFLDNDILKIIKNLRIDGEGIETSSWKSLESEMRQFESVMVEDDNQSSLLQSTQIGSLSFSQLNIGLVNSSGGINSSSSLGSSINNNNNNNNNNNSGQISPRKDFEESSKEFNDTKLIVLVSLDQSQDSPQHKEVIVPVQRKSQAGDIIRSLLSSNSNLKELGEWGLFAYDQTNIGRFLKDDEYIFDNATRNVQPSEDGATPRVRSVLNFKEYHLKMIPWKVRVSLERVKDMGLVGIFSDNKYIAEEPMDPTMTCAGLVYHLIKKHLPEIDKKFCLESDDFGLYLDSSSSSWGSSTAGGYWLEPLEKLHDYEAFKDPKSTVVLKPRPKGVKLKFADGTFEIFRLDLMSPTEVIFAEISEKVIDSTQNNINLSYYGIFVDRQQDGGPDSPVHEEKKRKPEWLEKGYPLYHYRINNRVCLRFAVRPCQVPLMIDESLFNQHNPPATTTCLTTTTTLDEQDLVIQTHTAQPSTTTTTSHDRDEVEDISKLKFELPLPIQSKQINVQLPLHLPLGEALETEDNWIETNIDRSKCSFHIDSFDGQVLNQFQPLNTQGFTEKNKLYVLMADELEISTEQFNHNKTNIWDEAFDSSTILVDPDNPAQIRAATLNKLLEQATNNIEKERELMNILLMTYMSFATSDILLDKLIERYTVPESDKDQKAVVQLHTIVFLKNWLEQQAPQAASGGGLEEKFLERLLEFVDVLSKDGYTQVVPQLKKWIDSALKEKRAYAMPEVPRVAPLGTKPATLSSSLLDDELFVAQQLTLREYDIFKRIQAVEFLNQAWGKPKLQYKAPNLLKMIERFNKISTSVSTAILAQPKLKTRVKLICRFIKIAQHFKELNNYHLLTAFMAGIRNSNVVRLRFSWDKVSKRYHHILEDLEKIMSMEGSFKEFRTRMAETIPPCIPYLGVYLKDLTFIEDGNPDTINSLINWGKKKLIYNIISIIQRCQQIPYDFGPLNPSAQNRADLVLSYFDHLPTAEDEVLYQISLNLEPRQQSSS
ncbi:hypothetical protein CYY_002711 [Polysphondylium violaceum]|uniref:Ras guanine nucleotide exchange factor n=1 Tax=Polysphondylium violaceum TaxID=133409 RepID=A0A8J4V9D6_9MYCE|nr:hypothetical protein CYY_002711 [Polysphondylium violaceum]